MTDKSLWCLLIVVFSAELVNAQESCYGPGSIAASVILTFILTALFVIAVLYVWNKFRAKKGKYLFIVRRKHDQHCKISPNLKAFQVSKIIV